MKYLFDTCVVSELIKKKPDENLVNWLKMLDINDTFLSVITIGEIVKGIEKLKDVKKKEKLNKWLYAELVNLFKDRIYEIDFNTMVIWGKIQAESEIKGKKLPVIDSLISAIAVQNDAIVITRNTKDFIDSGCKYYNPWI